MVVCCMVLSGIMCFAVFCWKHNNQKNHDWFYNMLLNLIFNMCQIFLGGAGFGADPQTGRPEGSLRSACVRSQVCCCTFSKSSGSWGFACSFKATFAGKPSLSNFAALVSSGAASVTISPVFRLTFLCVSFSSFGWHLLDFFLKGAHFFLVQ